jgi:hypothetical protein
MGVVRLTQPVRNASKALTRTANPVRFQASAVRSACRDYLRLMIAAAVDAFQARWVDAENRKSLL